ncbi:MAG: TatD family hydrolase [Cyanobacteria bacterium P01_A01_bin.17]
MQLIDTHVHLNFEAFQPDLNEIVQRWRECGIVRLVHSCVTPSEFPVIQALAQQFPELYFAVGLHPMDMDQWTTDTADHIRSLAQSDSKVVAIGETGLDLFKAQDRVEQEHSLWAHLQIARDLGLPVILHCRDAAQPMANLLHRFWAEQGPVTGVMHCWSGTPEETQMFLDLGFYVSFSGIVTFKNAKQVHASAQMVSCDRILIETDCPFLTPEPKRKQRRNEPANVYHVAEKVAKLRNVSLETLAAETTANACRLFQLPVPTETPTLIHT